MQRSKLKINWRGGGGGGGKKGKKATSTSHKQAKHRKLTLFATVLFTYLSSDGQKTKQKTTHHLCPDLIFA